VDGNVRRSSRLNKNDGLCAVRLEREPAKKRKINIVQINEKTSSTGPVLLSVLQGWGIDCGIAPEELSNEKLMQAPTNQIQFEDEDTDEAFL